MFCIEIKFQQTIYLFCVCQCFLFVPVRTGYFFVIFSSCDGKRDAGLMAARRPKPEIGWLFFGRWLLVTVEDTDMWFVLLDSLVIFTCLSVFLSSFVEIFIKI